MAVDNTMQNEPTCSCFDPYDNGQPWQELALHTDEQDITCEPWKYLLECVEQAARDGRSEFAPLRDMPWEARRQIVALPPTIAKLKAVKHLLLYRTNLVRIPPEIGEMSALEEFTPYTSYRLHWFPYEITRCTHLVRSTISTRALYGNYKFRSPFPRLSVRAQAADSKHISLQHCSVCNQPIAYLHQAWISLRVATDIVPLLVNACSGACLQKLPHPAEQYVPYPHQGGLALSQPPATY
jgi:hypothetical protein